MLKVKVKENGINARKTIFVFITEINFSEAWASVCITVYIVSSDIPDFI